MELLTQLVQLPLPKEFDIKIYAHEKEESTLKYPDKNVSWMIGANESYHADVFLKDNEMGFVDQKNLFIFDFLSKICICQHP